MFVRSVGVCVDSLSGAELRPRASEPKRNDQVTSGGGRPQRPFTPGASGSVPLVRSLLLVGVSTLAMAVAAKAIAQDAELPPLVVEGNQPKPKKKAAAKKALAAAAPVAMQPQPQATSSKSAASPTSTTPYSVPAGVSVVTGDDLGTYGSGDINSAMRSQPGTFTRVSPQNPGLAVNIRGFEGQGRVNTNIDGVRQNFRFAGHEAQGFAYIDPSLIAGIEIERGAVSTAGGAGALAGAANLRTLDVQDILLPGQTIGGFTKLTYGSNNQRFTGLAAAAAQGEGVGIAGAVGRRNPTNYENGDGVIVPRTFEDLYSGLFKANFQLNEEHSLRFGGVFYNNDFFANSYFQDVTTSTFTAKYAYSPVDNDLVDFRLNGYRNEIEVEYGPNASGAMSGSSGRLLEDDGWGFDVSNISRFHIGGIGVRSEYGYEYFRDSVDTSNVLNPALGGGPNGAGNSSIGGAFSETTFSQGMFDFIVGLRYDTYSLEGSGEVVASYPLLPIGPYSVDKSEGGFSPKLTLSAKPVEWFQPYVTYSESFRAPTINETLMGGSHPGGASATFQPNPFLDPETQRGWEFGFNSSYRGALVRNDSFYLKADYFTMDVEDYIATFSTASYNYFYNTPGTSKVQGVELQSMYDARFVFAGLSYTYTDVDLPSQTNGFGAATYVPDHVIVGSLGVRLFDEKLTVGGRVSYFGQTAVGAPNVGSFYDKPYMPSYTLLDLYSSYEIYRGLEVGLNVDNLLDLDYSPAQSTTQGNPFGGSTCFGNDRPTCNASGMGRTVYATVKAQF
jgi:hemoglobin/transferrin/lactoferrin receptor protein